MIGTWADGAHSESTDAVGSTYGEEFAVRCRLRIPIAIDNTSKGTRRNKAALRQRELTGVLQSQLDELGKRHTQKFLTFFAVRFSTDCIYTGNKG